MEIGRKSSALSKTIKTFLARCSKEKVQSQTMKSVLLQEAEFFIKTSQQPIKKSEATSFKVHPLSLLNSGWKLQCSQWLRRSIPDHASDDDTASSTVQQIRGNDRADLRLQIVDVWRRTGPLPLALSEPGSRQTCSPSAMQKCGTLAGFVQPHFRRNKQAIS